jgi:hypothetical protein
MPQRPYLYSYIQKNKQQERNFVGNVRQEFKFCVDSADAIIFRQYGFLFFGKGQQEVVQYICVLDVLKRNKLILDIDIDESDK